MEVLKVLWFLAVGHVLSDFFLQTEFMAHAKNPECAEAEVERGHCGPWWLWMGAHGMLNGVVTAWILGVWWFGPLEALHHALTDWAKCTGKIGFWQDQMSHGVFKLFLGYLVLYVL